MPTHVMTVIYFFPSTQKKNVLKCFIFTQAEIYMCECVCVCVRKELYAARNVNVFYFICAEISFAPPRRRRSSPHN